MRCYARLCVLGRRQLLGLTLLLPLLLLLFMYFFFFIFPVPAAKTVICLNFAFANASVVCKLSHSVRVLFLLSSSSFFSRYFVLTADAVVAASLLHPLNQSFPLRLCLFFAALPFLISSPHHYHQPKIAWSQKFHLFNSSTPSDSTQQQFWPTTVSIISCCCRRRRCFRRCLFVFSSFSFSRCRCCCRRLVHF